jgi:hypothetical protein
MSTLLQSIRQMWAARIAPRIKPTLAILALPMLFYACSDRLGGGTVYVYDAETKQPVPGIPVILHVRSTLPRLVPIMHTGGGTGCDSDFSGVTNSDGLVKVPYFSLFVWWRPSFSSRSAMLYVDAHQRGYIATITKQTGVAGAGHNATKSGPLRVELAMVKDKGTLYERVNNLAEMSREGCSCSIFHRTVAQEMREISPKAAREEAKRRGQPDLGGTMPGPSARCSNE